MKHIAISPIDSLSNIKRIMSGRPRVEIFHALRHITYGIPKLDPTSRTNVEAALALVRAECKPALDEGVLYDADVLMIALARIHANLIPCGTPTMADATAARLTAAGLLLLTHGPELVRCGLASAITLTVDQALAYTDRAFLAWMREATRSTYAMDRARPGRDAWLAGAANWAYYHPDRPTAARYWQSDLRRTAKLLRARGCLDVDDDGQAIEGPLWEALEKGPIEGLVKWPARGAPQLHPRKIRDIVEASFAKPGGMGVPRREDPDPADSDKEAKQRDRAKRQAMRVRDRNTAEGRQPTTEDIPVSDCVEDAPCKTAPTYAIPDNAIRAVQSAEAVNAIRRALEEVAQLRRADDRVTPVARHYFETWLTTGERPSQVELARIHDIDRGSLSKRIDRMEQDLKAHAALRDWGGWQATG